MLSNWSTLSHVYQSLATAMTTPTIPQMPNSVRLVSPSNSSYPLRALECVVKLNIVVDVRYTTCACNMRCSTLPSFRLALLNSATTSQRINSDFTEEDWVTLCGISKNCKWNTINLKYRSQIELHAQNGTLKHWRLHPLRLFYSQFFLRGLLNEHKHVSPLTTNTRKSTKKIFESGLNAMTEYSRWI